jgi:site-specific DNA-methyltransferase (adenine-specific)
MEMIPLFDRDGIVLYHGRAEDVVPTLDAASVAAIITDLPYGLTACAWDTVIPFPVLWTLGRHILRPAGVFVTTASQPFTSALIMSNPTWFKYEWIWDKGRGSNFASLKYQPFKEHENIVVFCAGTPVYNPQRKPVSITSLMRDNIGERRILRSHRRDVAITGMLHNPIRHICSDGYRAPSSVLHFNVPQGHESIGHPTQKPVDLYAYLISTYTNPGDLVLDLCCGSGTTLIAAWQLGRRAIGVEQDAGYCEIAVNRLAAALAQPRLLPVTPEAETPREAQGELWEKN